MQKILVVEDEPKIATLHKDYMEQSGFKAHIIDNGDRVVDWVKQNDPDLIILDLMLPGKDGLTVCREIRGFSMVPIIMVTARIEEIDRILGLELGADDYVCKPVSPRELVARVRANVRRSDFVKDGTDKDTKKSTDLVVDESRYKAWLLDKPLELTAIEFQLLLTLVNQPGRIFSREQIMQNIYSDSRIVSDRTIDSHVKKLRRKLQEIDPDTEYIHSLYGVGFKYEKEDKAT